jgi:tRNA-dihydrouridine synthase
LPGQIARALDGGGHESGPPLAAQYDIIVTLYDEMLSHYGSAVGRKHARKHLGWALEAAAVSVGAPIEMLKAHRGRVLPPKIRRRSTRCSKMRSTISR